ncbi:glycosyltransferase family 4 protein [Candidatus Saccharibacteria bacterium]|nr:glycosyltransferase family 4 protein [Candidatus Saccharibacteria bacterium]
MKIALVCPYDLLEKSGGVGDVVTHLHKGLVKNGHIVRVITPRPNGYRGKIPKDYIFLGTSSKFRAGPATEGAWTFNIDSDEIKEVLDREKFDVINFHEPWAPILARQILPLSNAGHVGTFHANLTDSMATKSLVNLFLPYGRGVGDKLDLITAVSPAPAAVLINKDPNNRLVKNIKYIPNGIDLKTFQTKPTTAVKHPKMKTIFYIGRLEGRKGIKYLLRAFNDLAQRNENVQLLIAGRGPDENKLRDYVSENEIPRVTFLGFISDADKIHHLHRADVFCSAATHGESFGIVLLEAMAAGCPIVAGDNIGYQSVMKGTGAISLINPKDIVDFSRRLEIMLTNEDIRRVWLKWAKDYIKQFDYKTITEMYESAYKEAIKLHADKPKPRRWFSFRRQLRQT